MIVKTNININYIELKLRIFYSIYSLLTIFIICFSYRVEIFYLISSFFLTFKEGFIYTGLLDPIIVYIKLSVLFSFFIFFPFFIYLIGTFFFKSFFNFYLTYFIIYFLSLYIVGAFVFIFISKLLFPIILEFLISFQRVNVENLLEINLQATITQYYRFFSLYILFYIFLLLIPNFFLVLVLSNIIPLQYFLKQNYRKYLYLLTIIFFLIIAPPDFFIQLVLLPFIIFFLELFIFFITFFCALYFNNFLRREGFEPTMK